MPPASDTPPVIVWFRQDLRVVDHPALTEAVQSGAPIIPLFVFNDTVTGRWTPGGASRWWLEGSLSALDTELRSRGSRLTFRRGNPQEVLGRVTAQTGAASIFFTRLYEANHAIEELAVAAMYEQQGLVCRRFGGGLLFEPEAVRTKTGSPFRVFTPFYKACLAINNITDGIKHPLPAPDKIKAPATWPDGETLKDWRLRPTAPDWAKGLRDQWRQGTDEASTRLDNFLENGLATYPEDRDRPDRAGTSALSPYLHFGEINPRQIWHRTSLWADSHSAVGQGKFAYLRELVWREFSYHLLHHFPHMTDAPFNPLTLAG